MVEGGGPYVGGDAIRVEDPQLAALLVVGAGQRAHQTGTVRMARRGKLLKQLAVRRASLGLSADRPVALRKTIQQIVVRQHVLAPERLVLRPGVDIRAAIEQPVGHRKPVGRSDRDRRKENCRKKRHFADSPSVASEKFQTSASRQVSITETSDS